MVFVIKIYACCFINLSKECFIWYWARENENDFTNELVSRQNFFLAKFWEIVFFPSFFSVFTLSLSLSLSLCLSVSKNAIKSKKAVIS